MSKEQGKRVGAQSRRKFTPTVTAALVAAPLAASTGRAQTPSTTKESPAPPHPQPSPVPAASPSAPAQQQQQQPSPLADAYAEVARVRFGGQVTSEQLEQIKRDLRGNVRAADSLRAVKLRNADEPDFAFNA